MHRDKGKASCPGKGTLIYQVLFPSAAGDSKASSASFWRELQPTQNPKGLRMQARADSSRAAWEEETGEGREEESWQRRYT